MSWVLLWPSLVVGLFFVLPFMLLLRVSVARPGLGAAGTGGFALRNYAGLAADGGFIDSVGFSLALAVGAVLFMLAGAIGYTLIALISDLPELLGNGRAG